MAGTNHVSAGTQPAAFKRWLKLLDETRMLYLFAMSGYGKTTQARAFAAACYKEWAYLSAAQEDFERQLRAFMSAHGRPRVKTLLILDDLQWVKEESSRQSLFDTLLEARHVKGLQLLLLSRAPIPSYLVPLKVTRQMATEDRRSLTCDMAQVREMMSSCPTLSALPESRREQIAQACLETTQGYPLGVSAFCQRIDKNPDDLRTAAALATQDIFDFLTIHLLGEWTPSRQDAAIRLSVFERFDREMVVSLLGSQANQILRDFLDVGSFLQFKAPDSYSFAPFFRDFLRYRLAARPRAEWVSYYETAAECYEKRRDYEQALRCWRKAGRVDRIAELVVYLSENAEGCAFASIAQTYMAELSPEWEQRDPRILGAKAMLAAYRMQPDECRDCLERLRQAADAERKCVMRSGAMETYVRTVIACPCASAAELRSNMLRFAQDVAKTGLPLKNIMPTGNMPSLISGGLDLLPWEKDKKALYPVMKAAAGTLMGREGVGVADAAMGEILYEQNQRTQAVAYLTKALSAAGLGGSIRVQYAATAIMARLLQAEGQADTAEDILRDVRRKAEQEHFGELLPNLNATLMSSALLRQDLSACGEWLHRDAPDEYALFYITMRYQLLTKARVDTAMGRTMEALYILNLLENYAEVYGRTYFRVEVLLLKAIVLYRREEDWLSPLRAAWKAASPYGLVRVFADQGAALLPLWKQADWDAREDAPPGVILKELKRMAGLYPNYLKTPRRFAPLSGKEQEVLRLMADGCNNTQIAELLGVNLGTAKFHVANIMKKLEAENRTVAVRVAQEEGLL